MKQVQCLKIKKIVLIDTSKCGENTKQVHDFVQPNGLSVTRIKWQVYE